MVGEFITSKQQAVEPLTEDQVAELVKGLGLEPTTTQKLFEQIRNGDAVACMQSAGDVVYLPPGWGHWVYTVEVGFKHQGGDWALSLVDWHTPVDDGGAARAAVLRTLATARTLEHTEAQVGYFKPGQERITRGPAGTGCWEPAGLSGEAIAGLFGVPWHPSKKMRPEPREPVRGDTLAPRLLATIDVDGVDAPYGHISPGSWTDLVGTISNDDIRRDNTLDVNSDSEVAVQFFEQLVGSHSVKEQDRWHVQAAIPAVEFELSKIKEAQAEVDLVKLNTSVATSVYKKGHVTLKHAHALGVINILLRGVKLWILWKPGVDGPAQMVLK
jgi:hypothetical protein